MLEPDRAVGADAYADAAPLYAPDLVAGLALRLAARPPSETVGWRADAACELGHFCARMRDWSALLRARPGRHFALYLEDSLEFGAALLGAWQAGKTVWLSADTLAASCAALAVKVDGFLGDFPAALAPLSPPPEVPGSTVRPHALDPAFPALVVHTSGSTGAPQAIAKRLDQLASEVATLEALFGHKAAGAAVLATVSHQHIYGLLFKVLWPLAAGRPVYADSVSAPEALAVLLARRPCVLVASPAHLKRLPEHLDWAGARGQLRAVFSSGGPLAPEAALRCARLLEQVPVEVYGSSETGGMAWRQRGIGSDESWQAFPGVSWRLSQPGQLLEVRSPHLPDSAWLRLSDRAMASGGQRFMLLGRADRIVKIEEKRISLDAIEAALLNHDAVGEARVALCDPVPGVRHTLAAFVVLTAAGRAQLAADGKLAMNRRLRAALGGAVDPLALPRRWRYLERMPLNGQGKTTQAALMASLGKAAPVPAPPRRPRWLLLESAPLRVVLELTVPAELLYLEGHFSDAPILPGVVQLDWAIAYGRQYFALPPRFCGVHALKFQHVIQPEQSVRLELQHDPHKNCLQFRYVSASGQHASGRILFGPADLSPPERPC
ncbi:MAG: AMP-binding protein [Pseudomonadota bacterium]